MNYIVLSDINNLKNKEETFINLERMVQEIQ